MTLKKRVFLPARMQLLAMAIEMMRLAGASSADRHDVALLSKKTAARQVAHQLLVDRRAGKGEVGKLLGERQLGDPHLVPDRARLLLRDLGLE